MEGYWGGQILEARASLSPTIFNVVVDAVVQHWLTWVCGRRTSEQGLGMKIYPKGVIFYADNGWLLVRDGM